MPSLGSATYDLLVNASRMRGGMAQAERYATSMSGRIRSSLDNAGRSMQMLGRNMTLFVTGPLALFAEKSVQAQKDFQDTMQQSVGLAEIGAGKTAAQTRKLTKQVGSDITTMGIKFGTTAREMAKGLYFISSAGFKAESSMKILKQVAMGSASGLGQMQDVALATVGALHAYNLKADESKNVMNALSMAVRKGVGEADAFAKVMGAVMGPARDAGVAFDEVSAAIAVMTKQSMTAARGATSLRSIIMRFQNPTTQVAESLKKMGLTAGDVRDMMAGANQQFDYISQHLKNAPGASEAAKQGFGGLANTLLALKQGMEETGIRAAQLFDSIRSQPGFNALIADAKDTEKVFGSVNKAFNNQINQNKRAFEAMTKSLGFALRKLGAIFEAFQLRVGKLLEPVVRAAAKRISGLVDTFMKLGKVQQDQIIKWGGIAAAAGPVLFIFGTLLRMSRFLVGGTFGTIAAVLTAVGIGIGTAAIKSASFRKSLASLGQTVSSTIGKVGSALHEIWDTIVPKIAAFGESVLPHAEGLIKSIGNLITTLVQEAGPFFSTLVDLGSTVLPPIVDVLKIFANILTSILDLIGGKTIALIGAFALAWMGVVKALRATSVFMAAIPAKMATIGKAFGAGGIATAAAAAPAVAATGSAAAQLAAISPSVSYSMAAGLAARQAAPVASYPTVIPLAGGQFRNAATGKYMTAARGQALTGPWGVGGATAAETRLINPYSGLGVAGQVEQNLSSAFSSTGSVLSRVTTAGTSLLVKGVGGISKAFTALGTGIAGLINPTTMIIGGVLLISKMWGDISAASHVFSDKAKQVADDLRSGVISFNDQQEEIAALHEAAINQEGGWWGLFHPIKTWESFLTGDPILPSEVSHQQEEAARQEAVKFKVDTWNTFWTAVGMAPHPRFAEATRAQHFVPILTRGVMAGRITSEQGMDIAHQVENYHQLASGMHDVSTRALHLYIRHGMLDNATNLLSKATKEATKTFNEHAKSFVEGEGVYKNWIGIVDQAVGMSYKHRNSVLRVVDALKISGLELNVNQTQLLTAAIKTGEYGAAMELLRNIISKGTDGVHGLQKALQDVPSKLRKELVIDLKVGRDRDQKKWASPAGLERMIFDLPYEKIDPDKLRTLRTLEEIMGNLGQKLGPKQMAKVKAALKTGDWDSALKTFMRRIGSTKEGLQALLDWKLEHVNDPWRIEFTSNLQQLWDDMLAFQKKNEQQTWRVSVRAISDTGAGSGGGAKGSHQYQHFGGWIKGGTRSDVPATLQEGEFVVNRRAANMHRGLLEQINRFHDGGAVEMDLSDLQRAINAGVTGRTRELAGKYKGAGGLKGGSIKKIAAAIEAMGYTVGEGPGKYGPINPVHAAGSYHYLNEAVDVNWYPVSEEKKKLDKLYRKLLGTPGLIELIWQQPGHYDHLHVAAGSNVPNGTFLPAAYKGGARRRGEGYGSQGGDVVGEFGAGLNVLASVHNLAQAAGKGGGPDAPKNVSGAIAAGKRMAARRGWTGNEWDALYNLWSRESGWRWWADNPTSTAYGIPQSLPGSKMATAGADWKTNPITQIKWGLNYIAGRYGDPLAAWAHSNQVGWYGNGGLINRPSIVGVGERGREAIVPLDSVGGRGALANAFEGGKLGRTLERLIEVVERGGDETIVLKIDDNEVSRVQRRKELLRRR